MFLSVDRDFGTLNCISPLATARSSLCFFNTVDDFIVDIHGAILMHRVLLQWCGGSIQLSADQMKENFIDG